MQIEDNGLRQRQRFERHFASILSPAYGMALHMTRCREEAEDLVQEATLQAFKAFDQFKEGTNFKAWFFQILINRFRYNYRKRSRQPQQVVLDDAPDLYLYVQMAGSGLLAESDDPAALVLGRMTEEQVGAAMAALPEEFRIVCALYFLEEMAYQDIADILACPVGTVRSRLHRGRKLLQKALWMVAQEYGVVNALTSEKEERSGQRKESMA